MNERATRQSDEQTASQTNGKWTNSTNKRLQTRELNKWLNDMDYNEAVEAKTNRAWHALSHLGGEVHSLCRGYTRVGPLQ